MESNRQFIESHLRPHIPFLSENWLTLGSSTGIPFSCLALGRYRDGALLSEPEIDRLASFTGYMGLDNLVEGEQLSRIYLMDFAKSELNLPLQFCIYKAVKATRGEPLRTCLQIGKDNLTYYAYICGGHFWFRHTELSDFKKQEELDYIYASAKEAGVAVNFAHYRF